MERTNPITCPSCGTQLKTVRGVRVGQKIACGSCATAFTVEPEQPGPAGSVNRRRLGIVLAGGLLYLLAGVGLAAYCFSHNADSSSAARGETDDSDSDEDEGPPPPRPSPPRRGALTPAQQRKVDDAVARGVWFLREQMPPGRNWAEVFGGTPGAAALPALALLECGVPADDSIIQKAAKQVREQAPVGHGSYDTYQRSLAVLFLDRLGAAQDKELIRYLALCLVAGQHPRDGAWTYFCPTLERKKTEPFLGKLESDESDSLDRWRKDALQTARLPPQNWGNAANPPEPVGWDNSNTQFAILALWVARRHGVPIDKSVALVEKHFRTTQLGKRDDPWRDNLDLDGSWFYNTTQNAGHWPSMTCSGLLGLAIAHVTTNERMRRRAIPLDDPAIRRGLAMLAREIDRRDEKRPWDLYFLWSLERVGVLYDLPAIDGKDWYGWGRKALLRSQRNDGAWGDGGYVGANPVLNTCFALLFLKRANLAQDLTDKLQLLSRR
jgi:hypothetical protein